MSDDVIELVERVERLERRDGVALTGAAVAGLATLLLAGALALRGGEAAQPQGRAPRVTATTLPAVWRREVRSHAGPGCETPWPAGQGVGSAARSRAR